MIVSFWRSNHRLGSLGDDEIRSNFRRYFAGEIGREHWRNTREIDRAAAHGRRGRRFWTIADEEYRQAVASGPPVVPAAFPAPRGHPERMARLGLVVGGVVGGVGLSVLSRFVWRRQRT